MHTPKRLCTFQLLMELNLMRFTWCIFFRLLSVSVLFVISTFFFIFIPLWCACVHFIHVRCSSSIVHKMNEKNVEFYIRFVRFAIYFAFSSTIILYVFNKIAFALRLLMVAEQTPSFYPETNLFIFTLENGWCIQYITLELSVQK